MKQAQPVTGTAQEIYWDLRLGGFGCGGWMTNQCSRFRALIPIRVTLLVTKVTHRDGHSLASHPGVVGFALCRLGAVAAIDLLIY